MLLKEIFAKDIKRYIEGVIKADDEENIVQEIEEYVITKELEDKLDNFFDQYSSSIISGKAATNTGIWISGFFGSGKSHLLKILSNVLQNRKINGNSTGTVFLDKIDPDDFELRNNLDKAIKIPAKSLLFNIDQKSDITSKTQPDAVLSVFVKVFDEMQGYYPKYGYVAEFERDLDKQGLYEDFKSKYREIAGETWEAGRETILLEIENFGKSLSAVKGISYEEATKVIDQYEKQYKVSIEDFAKNVKEYIDKQPDGFRLIFCVDEMGQYISDSTKLMLNLQTISETLSTICRGQAWIIVTSQEDIDSLVGDMTARQANDFSRIQARFSTPINLTSANVDEVIQKRLLAKNEQGTSQLKAIYDKEQNNFKTLFHFTESRHYHTYKDLEHFTYTYPFVPYQFDLFQGSIRGLSKHNAFQGRHQSVGERSMLSVFQIVAQGLADEIVGRLVTYDQLFDGIRPTLRSEIQSSVINAERNILDLFQLRVMKALFLVKYVQEFKATCKNIAILLIESFDTDLLALEKKVQESLNRLEDQTYIQQVGGLYEFLTDDEKDVEDEIKATDIDGTLVKKTLSDLIFYDIVKDPKIRFEDNKQDYSFARKLDHQMVSRESELAINFITPLCENEVNENILKTESMGRAELIICLQDDPKLKQELELFHKTQKYIQQTQSSALSDSIKSILATKGSQNSERKTDIRKRLEELIANGAFYVNGNKLELTGESAKPKVLTAFQELIKIIYPNLRMLTTTFTEQSLRDILLLQKDDLFQNGDKSMSEAEQELLNFINRTHQSHERVSTKSLLDTFSRRRNGWYQMAVLCILAKLFLRGKIEVTHNSNVLEKNDLLSVLNNNREFPNTIIQPFSEIDDRKVKAFKDFYRELFDESIAETEIKAISSQFKHKIESEIGILQGMLDQSSRYPFLNVLQQPVERLRIITNKDASFLFNNLSEYKDEILDFKEETIDPVKRFMSGEQRKIYDEVLNLLVDERANLGYLENDHVGNLERVKDAKEPYRTGQIKEAKSMMEKVKGEIETKVKEERDRAALSIDDMLSKLTGVEEFSQLNSEQQDEILKPIRTLKDQTCNEQFIPVIRESVQRLENQIYQSQLEKIFDFLKDKTGGKPTKKIVSFNAIRPAFDKATLDTTEDVLAYIEALRKRLLSEIESNKKISL